MTCTTHHICDCLKLKMEKLGAVAATAREVYEASFSVPMRQLGRDLEQLGYEQNAVWFLEELHRLREIERQFLEMKERQGE